MTELTQEQVKAISDKNEYDLTLCDFSLETLTEGANHEYEEHDITPEIAVQLSYEHLMECDDYYEMLEKFEERYEMMEEMY